MDYCQIQRLINELGGSGNFPSYKDVEPYYPHDRTTQYGFGEWIDMIPHLPKGSDYWEKHPARSGVYAISVVQGTRTDSNDCEFTASHLLYIGSSKNILKRLSGPKHPLRTYLKRFDKEHHFVVVTVLLTKDYLWAEKSLIKTLRPWFNIQHNG